MIGVDARKAFDSVDHNYMQGALEAQGFGPKCKNWFKLLSKNLKANILVNGFTTESITVRSIGNRESNFQRIKEQSNSIL